MALSEQQRRFAEGVLAGRNATDAYIEAGYKTRGVAARVCASKLLSNANLAAYLDARRKEIAALNDVTIGWVRDRLRENVERSMTIVPVLDPLTGEPTGIFQYQGSIANKALELLGRHLAMFVDKAPPAPSEPLEIIITRTNRGKRSP